MSYGFNGRFRDERVIRIRYEIEGTFFEETDDWVVILEDDNKKHYVSKKYILEYFDI